MKINNSLPRNVIDDSKEESFLGGHSIKVLRKAKISLPSDSSKKAGCDPDVCDPDRWGCMGDCDGHCWSEGGPKG